MAKKSNVAVLQAKLTREELLELENLELKLNRAREIYQTIVGAKQAWRMRVEKNHGVNLGEFEINVETGVMKRRAKEEKKDADAAKA